MWCRSVSQIKTFFFHVAYGIYHSNRNLPSEAWICISSICLGAARSPILLFRAIDLYRVVQCSPLESNQRNTPWTLEERSAWMELLPNFILESSTRAGGKLPMVPSLLPAPRSKALMFPGTVVQDCVTLALPWVLLIECATCFLLGLWQIHLDWSNLLH